MKQTTKQLFVLGVFLALSLHFTWLFLNNSPFTNRNSRMYFWSQRYVYPFFQQTWQLFAPAPDANYELIACYENNGLKYTDVFNDLLISHQSNRAAGKEPLLLCFASGIHIFEKNAASAGFNNGLVQGNTHFEVIEKLCLGYLNMKLGFKPKAVKLTLVVKPCNGQPARIYYNQT